MSRYFRVRHRLFPAALMILTTAGLLVGCGGGSGGGGNPTPKPITVNVRDGVWQVTTHLTEVGTGECTADSTSVDTTAICFLDFAPNNVGDLQITCSGTQDGSTFDFNCGGSLSIPPCTVFLTNSGTGSFTDTTFQVNSTTRSSVGGGEVCEATYGAFANACTTNVAITGAWLHAEPDTARTCDDSSLGKGLSIKRLARFTLGQALLGP